MERVGAAYPRENPPYHVEGWFHDLPSPSGAGTGSRASTPWPPWPVSTGARADFGFLQPPGRHHRAGSSLEYYRRAVLGRIAGPPVSAPARGLRWLVANQPADNTLALSWGDAKLGNCVFRDGRPVAALDWELATLAHPVDDLAWWLMLDDSRCPPATVCPAGGLPTRAESVARWEQASGFSA